MRHIFRYFSFDTLDYRAAERFLNDMAERGYEFKGTGKGWIRNIAIFEKNERAKERKYAIDVAKRKEEEKESYYRFYKDLGWEKVDCFHSSMYIFSAQKNNTVKFYTDKLSERSMLKKAVINNGELSNHISQFICMLIISSSFMGGKENRNDLTVYGFKIFFSLIMGYYALKVAIKLIYALKGWKARDTHAEEQIQRALREINKVCQILFFLFLPVVCLIRFFYHMWEKEFVIKGAAGMELELIQLLLCMASILITSVTTYLVAMYPDKDRWKVLDFIGIFMYFAALWSFLTYIL
ncbi:DUF2812 domain-containing protein [Aminipila luticellarii]|uniref:DUF2812 domain-containing protein n=1 Tax=Aminipila luticellarii TaxID=2507160 RepID=A0A410PS87_9FIRM|nr:DUF2812 domain-containing protein [Aminipila luticellarii]QAT41851.1 DUF2812 domain-containing protein [Aminipila luticellarii]